LVRKIKPEEVTKEQRSFDKAVKFGMNYGRSNKSISETYNLPLEEVDEFVNNYFESHPHIAAFRKKVIRLSKKLGYLQTPTGRRRHFTAYEWLYSQEMEDVKLCREDVGLPQYTINAIIGNMERQALNYIVQADAFDSSIPRLDFFRRELKKKYKDSAYLILSVHDMAAVDHRKKDSKKIEKLMKSCMTITSITKSGMTVTFPVDIGIGKHWVQ
jgi:DNA polymerase I-like protein with 3'-5' exonuclease and polymerase domains